MGSPRTDRRKRLRSTRAAPADLQVRYQLRGGESSAIDARIINATDIGCAVETNTPLDTGSRVTLSGDLTGRGMETTVEARIAWCRSRGAGLFNAGVEFVEPARVGFGLIYWGRTRPALSPGERIAVPPEERAAVEQRLRRQILLLLYNCRAAAPEPGEVSIADIESQIGLTRDDIEFSLWYLRQSGLASRSDHGSYGITVAGVDHVEAALKQTP